MLKIVKYNGVIVKVCPVDDDVATVDE